MTSGRLASQNPAPFVATGALTSKRGENGQYRNMILWSRKLWRELAAFPTKNIIFKYTFEIAKVALKSPRDVLERYLGLELGKLSLHRWNHRSAQMRPVEYLPIFSCKCLLMVRSRMMSSTLPCESIRLCCEPREADPSLAGGTWDLGTVPLHFPWRSSSF
jgi:hypothetical protein